jgi:uracil-DNA glycosylase family 4
MADEPRTELKQILTDLEHTVQVLRSFGLSVVKPRRTHAHGTSLRERNALPGPGSATERSLRMRREPPSDSVPHPVSAVQGSLFGSHFPEPKSITVSVHRQRWVKNPLSPAEAEQQLVALRQTIGDCTRCKLASGRNNIVFGEGDPVAQLIFIGEGPGQEEDRTGRPFVGRAGHLLDKIIEAMGLQRKQVFIGNVVKCRPPNNRTPESDEMRTCGQFLAKQIEIIRPRHIVCLGAVAAAYLLNTNAAMNKIRGRFFDDPSGARILPTFHPAYLLRNPAAKKMVWEDLQKVLVEMREPVEA